MTICKVQLTALVLFLTTPFLFAQNLHQTIRGTIVDKVSKSSLPGASVTLISVDPVIGGMSDPDGNFKLPNVPIGNHTLRISFIGYKDVTLPNIVVNSGKEVVLNVPIEEDIVLLQSIEVRPELEKNKPLNDMATVSARTFSVEETRKYAAAVNDPARMVASYAGVVQTSDGNNTISIRGNSPYGLLWRMEGVDIPNPNHFANVGSSGGGISILSSQLLTNSDFLTGAFPAEYGNALAGVFDLNLRKGNNEKHEYTIQAGFLGIDIAAEGPLAKNYRGSYLINYRYSTLSILSKFNVQITQGVTDFQDLSFNFYFPTRKAGNFSVFGFGGLSSQSQKAKRDSLQWEDDSDRYDASYFSNTGAAGVKHSITINSSTYLQSSMVMSGNNHGYEQSRLDQTYHPNQDYRNSYVNNKITFSTVLNHKFNAKSNMRSGLYLNKYFYNLNTKSFNYETGVMEQPLNASGGVSTIQLFSQWNYRFTEKLTFNAGIHYLRMTGNKTSALEPRSSLKYEFNERQWLSFGYGSHSQMQPVGIYVAEKQLSNGVYVRPNENLAFNKAQHYVLAYDRSVSKHLHVKVETYYQHLYNLAVSDDPSKPLSTSNNEEGYITEPLVNKGTGRNYGVELTVEQFTHKDLYFLLSSSLYDSKYKALDGVLRNSRFNGNYAFSFTAGKEFRSSNTSKNRVYGINIRSLYSGGFRTTPIDYVESIKSSETKYIESAAYSLKMQDYFRTDLRFSVKRNRAKCTTTLALDIQNVSNQQNIYGSYFDPLTGRVKTAYQTPLLPIISYKIEF
jgi:CarboxypepD_reg-like domain/TonB-dependent Receptor Plug Domain